MVENWESEISMDPNIRFSKPCIIGTRIAVQDILEWLAAGMSNEEILADFPELNTQKIHAAIKMVWIITIRHSAKPLPQTNMDDD